MTLNGPPTTATIERRPIEAQRDRPLPDEVEVAVVGAGASGIGTAARLRQSGFHDFVVLERAGDVGGTWRDNTYPGLTCDVPSRLYSLSFAPRSDWSRNYPPQPEIHDYMRRCVSQEGLWDRIRLGHEVTTAAWDEATGRWRVETTRGSTTARSLVLAAGLHSEPLMPDVAGLESFEGKVFHSARWDHDYDLRGRRVAVVGSGASAVQFVPAIQPLVEHMTVFQRSPGWVLPRLERPLPAVERALMRRFPALQRLVRELIYWGREATLPALVAQAQQLSALEAVGRLHLRLRVRDKALRRALTPDHRLGCKRAMISNDYYPALTRRNVTVVPQGVRAVTPRGVIAEDGVERHVDTIIFGTGYNVADPPWARRVRGRGEKTLAEHWERRGMRAYLGTTVPGFPNAFLMHGPNSGLGNGSQLFMIECQIEYTLKALQAMRAHALASIDVRDEVHDAYNDWLDERLEASVWTDGCMSWYLDNTGRASVVWPDYTWRFRTRTRQFELGDYECTKLQRRRLATTAGAAA